MSLDVVVTSVSNTAREHGHFGHVFTGREHDP